MLFRSLSAAVYGIDANLVDVEVDLTPVRNETDNPSSVIIVGLPDLAVRESRERIRGALPIALRARQQTKHLLLPDENAKEAAVVSDVNVYAVTDLRNAVELIAAIRSDNPPEPIRVDPSELLAPNEHYNVDFREV